MQNLSGGRRAVHYETDSALLYIWKFIWLNIRKNYKSVSVMFKVSVIPSTLYALTHLFSISLVTERGWLSTKSATPSPWSCPCFLTNPALTYGHMTELWPMDWERKWWVPSPGLAHRNLSHLRVDGNIITLVLYAEDEALTHWRSNAGLSEISVWDFLWAWNILLCYTIEMCGFIYCSS